MKHISKEKIEKIEFDLLLEAIYNAYGYDFRDYSKAHIKRRLIHFQNINKLGSFSEVQHLILHNEKLFRELLSELSIKVTEMFRDPAFYLALRKKVIPLLKTYPYPKIWIAGCATGEEVYSMAILLKEEGLLKRTQIFATDFNKGAVETAKKGIYSIDRIKNYTVNYQKAGGTSSFSDYYVAHNNLVEIDPLLRENVTFMEHNLVTDDVFETVNMISCRNVLIYFNKQLQNKVINLFTRSLIKGGYLVLGMKESLLFSDDKTLYKDIEPEMNIFQKRLTDK
jgi:chemotaxis protein methyltransferase CheR